MAVKTRFMALALVVVALALTVTGVVIAATDSNPGTSIKDPLALNGYPPSSADLLVTLSTGAPFGLSANVDVNFKSNRVDAVVRFPLVVATAAIEVRLIHDHLYARSADASSGPWLAAALKTPSLFGVALEMTKPDIGLITGFDHKTVSKSGYSTTYNFYRDRLAVSSLLGSATSSSVIGSVRWIITVGNQGEVSQSMLTVKTKKSEMTLSVTVLSYNQSARIATPAPSSVKSVSNSVLKQLLKSQGVKFIMVPRGFTSLAQAKLS
ncbi:MAG TPA: hypothetical protein VNF08_02635 [Acidimicrobiales bacterium]|nr:hypothetical protein [Acidimicrobiales bacterium]